MKAKHERNWEIVLLILAALLFPLFITFVFFYSGIFGCLKISTGDFYSGICSIVTGAIVVIWLKSLDNKKIKDTSESLELLAQMEFHANRIMGIIEQNEASNGDYSFSDSYEPIFRSLDRLYFIIEFGSEILNKSIGKNEYTNRINSEYNVLNQACTQTVETEKDKEKIEIKLLDIDFEESIKLRDEVYKSYFKFLTIIRACKMELI